MSKAIFRIVNKHGGRSGTCAKPERFLGIVNTQTLSADSHSTATLTFIAHVQLVILLSG